ncbi:acetate/propionate family kinase [Deinococcus maricopensis]|uniref:Acetate kinase n=1 Tax=Deinococcus maricopensis (strain DSM 21211 / LMG 22137 / NRRL B-23946 / LB-34) TaxID=709986 RepID=E8U8V5_DEIML|nr:acetate kinase [Deinococcus maricopensis]ADV67494.1 Acetate kinase [Deinococcus maricopensis DSM 21211]
MQVLVLNAGSSSLKYQLIDTNTGEVLTRGLVERIGTDVPDHTAALHQAMTTLPETARVEAVGHRVVHGGERFSAPTRITDAVLTDLDRLSTLAPLHNPPALQGIRAARALLPAVPMVAVFDTAFHSTLPPHAYTYAIPYDLYSEHGLRRYGFHGTSHAFVAREAAHVLGQDLRDLKLVTLHLGNGASAAAVQGGVSVDTSMGFTPLEGLVMGTRSGDIDPAIALWLAAKHGPARASDILNRESGLLGLSGVSNDLRDLHRAALAGADRAQLTLQVMVYRLRKQVGAYAAAMNGLDALVFTGGIGENDPWVRAQVVNGLSFLGFHLDEECNERRGQTTRITLAGEMPAALVIPTDEEGEIARQTATTLLA